MSCYLQHTNHYLWDNNFYTALFPNTGRSEKRVKNVRNSYIIHSFPYSYTLLLALIVQFNSFKFYFTSTIFILVLKHCSIFSNTDLPAFDTHRVGMISVWFLCAEKKQNCTGDLCCTTTDLLCYDFYNHLLKISNPSKMMFAHTLGSICNWQTQSLLMYQIIARL